MVREHAPELLLGRDGTTEIDRPAMPGYADPMAVPAAYRTPGSPVDTAIAPALRTASDPDAGATASSLPIAKTPDGADRVRRGESRPRLAASADGDRVAGRTHKSTSANRAGPAKRLALAAREVFARLSGRPRTEVSPVDPAVHSRQKTTPTPALKITQPQVPDRFPAWSWIGPAERTDDRTRAAYVSAAAEWPSLPAAVSAGETSPSRGAVRRAADPLPPSGPAEDPWPRLPDDTPLWTVPAAGHSAERLTRLEREQAGS